MTKLIFTTALLLIWAFTAVAQETVFHQEVTWSPDSKYISFSVYRMLNPNDKQLKREILPMKADGSEVWKVADNAAWTSWSKDAQVLLFSRVDTERKTSDIFSIKKDGSDLIQLTKDTKQNSDPAFSPDGKKITFTSTRENEKNQIYVMNSDGKNIRRLTTDSSVSFLNPMWSHDNRKIVFYSDKGDQKDQIWTMNARWVESNAVDQ